jgi:DNA-binding transcriptional ArsR family regulator
VDEGLETLFAVHRQHLQDEINWQCQNFSRPAGPWTHLDSDLELRHQLGQAIDSFHDAAVGPHWQQLGDFLRAERSRQIQRLAAAGMGGFLAALCPPLIQWHPPVLEIQTFSPVVDDWDLAGRGLTIVPSVFLSPYPTVANDLRDPDLAPSLTYPAVRELSTARHLWAAAGDSRALAALLGRTRSAALEAIAAGCGTRELGLRLGISPAAASQHATVLRRAGLITTLRHGGTVMHNVTALGANLLRAQRPGESGDDEARR